MTIALGSKWRAERRIVQAWPTSIRSTGLPNREQSRNRLVGALQAAKDNNRTLAVLYLDLDNFKRVNDTLGHAVGDELLCVVADAAAQLAALRRRLRAADDRRAPAPATSRGSGGDEFIVLLPNLRSAADAGTWPSG